MAVTVDHTFHARLRAASYRPYSSRDLDPGPRRPRSPVMGLPHPEELGALARVQLELDFPVLGAWPRVSGAFLLRRTTTPPPC